ncbi:trichoplein keratin filament-binding protein-like [Uloborus diversus]|uniref:trichoplein keratin filament-binding protein-like n=1 Tax=Uloborus diversus TaxID=327109 RepID=UPI002409B5A2|nr:trichoplein keratin filament-binding protein-like [Uloborus diversus]
MSLPSYWVSVNRKDLAEKAIVAKREKEALRAQKCKEVASYHKELALKSSKYRSLEETQPIKTPRPNDESSVREKLAADIKERLEIRRQRLAHLLAVENDQYMRELKELRDKEREQDPWNISRLKEQIEELQKKRKETEQNMQKRHMHHLFRSSASVKECEENQLQDEVVQSWEQRKEELERLNLEKKEKKRERQKVLELEYMKSDKEAKEVEMELLDEQEKWSCLVQSNVAKLNEAEAEIKRLKVEHEILISHIEKLLKYQERRKMLRDLQRQGTTRIHSLWQPKEKLRRMSNEAQHALDLDYKLLISLSELNNLVAEDTALSLISLDCVDDAKNKVEMQLALEKTREFEIQQMYNEEASKMWNKMQEAWSSEAVARDEILHEVFKSLSEEINRKINCVEEQQRNCISMKEACLRAISEINENSKCTTSILQDKMVYYKEKAKKLGEELESSIAKVKEEPRPQSKTYQRIFS